jgi:arabinofuranosyltransferase
LAREVPAHHQRLLVISNPFVPIDASGTEPAHSALPFTLAVNVPAIGVIGYLAGPDVYVFDTYSLANPIGSHTVVVHHARPGHEKDIGPAWMVARFGLSGDPLPSGAGLSVSQVAAARRALGCDPLASYLRAVTAPLSASRFLSNIDHALRYTTMSFSAVPSKAAAQLCRPVHGPGAAGAR